ncbi:tetratricopeptide repeat protein [Ramlibacter pallidus]|uniref:Tetratricopeptide repeat protein n=1 Tax=Ramlibacter pallidus TaxID=2780087 RepID=A0ABR9S0M3_9BURK|nr:tetratricopeptide repeat protein [Ramlibacter pallidus]MBE7367020.1 tetratricopeptide repeat protein [Ramlibacter pallidus]
MPIVAGGLYFALAIFCAVHVVRTRQNLYWLLILFGFPLLGSLVYFFAVYFPNSRLRRQAMKTVAAAAKAIDPQREVREARLLFEETPTAQNQMRLAAALLEVGQPEDAVQCYEACLKGPFAHDPEIRYGLARAYVECQRHGDALRQLEPLKADHPDYRPEPVSLLLARSLAGSSRAADARREYESAIARFNTWEAKAEYAIWAYAVGDLRTAEGLRGELEKIAARWNPMTRELNEASERRLRAARELAERATQAA